MNLEPQSRARRKLIAAARASAAALGPALPPALFVTDPARMEDPGQLARGLPAGFGVVYRHFGASDRSAVAAGLAAVCRSRGLAFLIAADPLLALQVKADGVHWPYRMRHAARRWRRRFALQTVSAHSGRQLRAAAGLPVDAVLLSAVFVSNSASAGPALGALKFAPLVRASGLPVYALGGVTAENAARVARSGGFAAVEGMRPFEKARS
ncbi:MAG: thiamine phosphate synthase [Alphaproteobacteria bacterium]|uniref:thiamine phosphate synthase n=1 Tax=Hyphomonas sp. TaxID=87 RepID=UPI001D60665E|nr:thiamine phosphate synthase [Hyphomonas sp.]MBU3919396.1 thiamine phosphate synthase [Alphaproteobacteria bacterium]MBU4061982.1 thiamine phosphate synthase [Alphaproteobacteria bacterium]MBU4166137.1 thiamine phosphate synthase [Alphaproteobacteria bacterium]MBU4569002.1 thiamine phosphate synthase [Alphaproteobacteria bacterium]